MFFGLFGVGMPSWVYFGLILEPVVSLKLAALPLLAEVCYGFAGGVWEAELLVVRVLAGCIELAMVMKLMCIALSTLLIPLFLLYYSFVAVLSPVSDVLKGIRSKGFTQSRWDALLRYWGAVCRRGPCGPISSIHPWDNWIHPDLHGFYKWVFDSRGLLNDILRHVVVSRRDIGIRKWTWWLREDLSSWPYAWLRSDFVLPSPFLVVKDRQTKSSRILVEPHLIDAEFRKAWMPFFCRSGHPVVTPDQFLDFVGHLLPQEPYLDLPRITGRDLQEVARAKKSSHGLSSRPLESCHHQCLKVFVGVLWYPKGSALELLDGTLKLPHCTDLFTMRFPPWSFPRVGNGGGKRQFVTPGHLPDAGGNVGFKGSGLPERHVQVLFFSVQSGSWASNAEEMEKIALPFLQRGW